MLRRSIHLPSKASSFNRTLRQANVDFSLKHSSEIPVAQAKPTFAAPKAPLGQDGAVMKIDTSFADIPEIGQEIPVPEDVIEALRELAEKRREEQVKVIMKEKMKKKVMLLEGSRKAMFLEAASKAAKNRNNNKNNSDDNSIVLSESQEHENQIIQQEIDRLMLQIDESEQEQIEQIKDKANVHFEKRAKLARAIVEMAEKMHLNRNKMDSVMSIGKDIKGMNSGPAYEMRTVFLQRRRSWFSLRHSFLSAAPVIFGYSHALEELVNLMRSEENNNNNNNILINEKDEQLLLEIASNAAESMTVGCQALTWMKHTSDTHTAIARPIEWDMRNPSDFEQIDYSTLATHLLQQFGNVLEFAVRVSQKSKKNLHELVPMISLDTLTSLLNLCDQYEVDREIVRRAVNGEMIHLLLDQSLEKNSKIDLLSKTNTQYDASERLRRQQKAITPMTAISLGLVCDQEFLQLTTKKKSSDNKSKKSVADRLLAVILQHGGGATLETFSGTDLIFLMEFLLKIKKANPEHDHLLDGKPQETSLQKPISSSSLSLFENNNNNSENKTEKKSETTTSAATSPTITLFNTVLIAAQRRMRILMHTNRGSKSMEQMHEAEIMDGDALNPLRKIMEYQQKNNASFTVLENTKVYKANIEGMKQVAVESREIIRFFKLLMDLSKNNNSNNNDNDNSRETSITATNDSQQDVNNNNSSKKQEVQNNNGMSLVCAAWMQDVVRRAALFAHGTASQMSYKECISLLETLAAAAPELYPTVTSVRNNQTSSDTFLRSISLIEKTIRERALQLTADELVTIFRSLVTLQPIVLTMLDNRTERVIPHNVSQIERQSELNLKSFPSCLDALEMRLLRTDYSALLKRSSQLGQQPKGSSSSLSSSKGQTDHSGYKNVHRRTQIEHQQQYRLSLNQQAEVTKCLIQIASMTPSNSNNDKSTSSKLAFQQFVDNSARALQRLEYVIKSQNKAPSNYSLIGNCLKNSAQMAVALVAFPSSASSLKSSSFDFSSSTNSPGNQVQLAVLLDTMMKLMVTPLPPPKNSGTKKQRKNQHQHQQRAALIDVSRLDSDDCAFIFGSIIQVLGSVSSSNKKFLPIIAPCHKICEEILTSISKTIQNDDGDQHSSINSKNFMSSFEKLFRDFLGPDMISNSEPALLAAARGFAKILSVSSSRIIDQTNNNSIVVQQQKQVSELLFSQLGNATAFMGRFNFLELVESLQLLERFAATNNNNEKVKEQIEAISSSISSALDQCSDVLRRSVISKRNLVNSNNSSSKHETDEINEDDERLLASLDTKPMAIASEKLVCQYDDRNQNNTNNDTINSADRTRQMKESALRFVVCSFAYEQQEAKRRVKDYTTSAQMSYDSSRLGFERSHLAKSAAQKEQSAEIKELGLIVRKCLNFVKQVEKDEKLVQAANEEWNLLMGSNNNTASSSDGSDKKKREASL